MSKKVYTLELTAEELWSFAADSAVAQAKLQTLRAQERRDRERDDLRLPWEYCQNPSSKEWYVACSRPGLTTERQVKLMSAAPELLEAVQAADSWGAEQTAGTAWWARWCKQVRPLIERALRKVETGVPE